MPAAAWPLQPDWFRPARRSRRVAGPDAFSPGLRRPRRPESEVTLTIRRARSGDGPALALLAQLDSAKPLRGDVLLASRDGSPVAALELSGDREIADPFAPSEEALAMLRLRAQQLHGTAAPAAERGSRRGPVKARPVTR